MSNSSWLLGVMIATPSMPGFPVLHYLPEFAQTCVHWIGDAIQPSHPLLPTSHLALSLSQHQGFFQWIGFLHQVAKYWSFSFSISPSSEYSGLISFRMDWLDLLQFKGLSRVFSNTTVQKHQFFCTKPSLWSNSHIHTWLLEKNHSFDCLYHKVIIVGLYTFLFKINHIIFETTYLQTSPFWLFFCKF